MDPGKWDVYSKGNRLSTVLSSYITVTISIDLARSRKILKYLCGQ